MTDAEISAYLLSHAPLDRFYLFVPSIAASPLVKYIDETGRSWNLMEDDDATAAASVAFLMRTGVKVFDDYAALVKFEQELANGRPT